jgi:hypothetical protein
LQTTDIAYSLRSNPELPSQEVPATLSPTQISRIHLNIGWKMHLPQNQRPQSIAKNNQINLFNCLRNHPLMSFSFPRAGRPLTWKFHTHRAHQRYTPFELLPSPFFHRDAFSPFIPQASETAFWNAKEDFGYGSEVDVPW